MSSRFTRSAREDVIVDIETLVEPVTAAEVEKFMEEYEPPKNYKDAAKILKHREFAMANAVSKISDAKRFSIGGKRTISVALGRIDGQQVVDLQAFSGEDLKAITTSVVAYLDRFVEYRLIGWNHIRFDLPELARCFKLTGVAPKFKPGKWDLVDLCKHPFDKIKLKDAASAFGIETIGMSGADVAQFYDRGDWKSIEDYNKDDVRITGELYLAASTIFSF